MCLLRCGIRIWFFSTDQGCCCPPGRCGNLDLNNSYLIFARTDRRGFDLISDVLPFGGLWYLDAAAAVSYAKYHSRSHRAIIRVFDESGAVIETHESAGDFREP